jgi:O-antigen ligase
MVLPLIGSLFVNGNNRHKITAIVTAPLALNVVIMCNSRGGFLALIGAGVAFLLLSPSRTRRQALKALALGGVVLYMLLGDPDIMNRFMTTFSGSEERDNSAASRIEFWKAGLLMLQDYPFGDGGGSFKRVRGAYYLAQVVGTDDVEDRSLHSGYLTEATEWGIQGLLIRLVFFGVAMVMAVRTSLRCSREGRTQDALMGTCFVAALISFLIGSIFGSFFSSEWSYWNVALLVRYGEIYRQPELALSAASVADRSKASRFEQASRAAAAAG